MVNTSYSSSIADPMEAIQVHRDAVERRLEQWLHELPDGPLYAPMAYLMQLPAKRIRPAAVLMGCRLFGGDPGDAVDEALGIEIFHNFTLMHDDIMDQAPLRRGMATVHERWDLNTAILSGDAMLVKAYQLMGRHPRVLHLFNEHALLVCEGQRLDMDFEQRDDVELEAYMEMIRLKTAVLLACALRIGASIAGAPQDQEEALGRVGENLGSAFQLRDDLLDAFGDPGKVGKQRGGDLRAGKKTWLLIRGLKLERTQGTSELAGQLRLRPEQRDVPKMLEVLDGLGVRVEAEAEVARHEAIALQELEAIAVPAAAKAPLRALAAMLMARIH